MADQQQSLDSNYLAWVRHLAAENRFGTKDRRGSANLIDASAQERARTAIQRGVSVGLARGLTEAASIRDDGRPAFRLETFNTEGPIDSNSLQGSDHLELDCHGVVNTHIDGLNHLAIDGEWYGGWSIHDHETPSISDLSDTGLFTRAVHLDIPSVRGTQWVAAEEPVTGADLDAAQEMAGLEILAGDALLIDMGRDRYEAAGNSLTGTARPGMGADGARWIAEHDISVVCWDFLDARHPSEPKLPLHLLNWGIGLLLVDNCEFTRLRHLSTEQKPYGALVIGPLPIPGATGCNVNPLVIL